MYERLVIAEDDLEFLILFFPVLGLQVCVLIVGLGVASWTPFMLGKCFTKLYLYALKHIKLLSGNKIYF